MTRVIDETGNTYGKLTVLSRAPRHDKTTSARWICLCECGNEHIVIGQYLRQGKTKSCGCAQGSGHILAEGESSLRHLIRVWKRQARLRDYAWHLTDDEIRAFIADDCHYCGLPPSNSYQASKRNNGAIVYSGLDRVDNSDGYHRDNVVPCCKYCNKAKNDRTTDEFYQWAEAVFRRSVLHVGKLDFVLI